MSSFHSIVTFSRLRPGVPKGREQEELSFLSAKRGKKTLILSDRAGEITSGQRKCFCGEGLWSISPSGCGARRNGTSGDIPGIIRSVQTAEACGIDCFDAGDHLASHRDAMTDYPFPGGRLGSPVEPFLDPLIMLSGHATVTTRIRLVTSVILAPLRRALLLAKQVATLDVLSNGRLDLGVGVGWQKQEYDAAGASWENRFAYLDEQIRACRTLWSQAPASYHGKLVSFDGLHAKPFPRQPGGVPICFGV
jgi:alkanesulfonate monooxygenase SsuD/methylene tetrahydromethanopterin reductase-like flavin-dependent oxidoreductase (luciferase family)